MKKLALLLAVILALAVIVASCAPAKPMLTPVPQAVVSTVAGSGELGCANGPAAAARFMRPAAVAVDGAGNVYVTDSFCGCIWKITSGGMVTRLAGGGEAIEGPSAEVMFNYPQGLAIDGAGNLYVAIQPCPPALASGQKGHHYISKISPDGIVITLAGSEIGYTDGLGAEARFNYPDDLAVDGAGNVYVADSGNHRIRKIGPNGVVTSLAGSGEEGYADGPGADAQFNNPQGVAVDGAGNVYVADGGNHRIRKISPDGMVTTLAGSGEEGYADGPAMEAKFNNPGGLAANAAGNIYVADINNHRIRKISPEGIVTTLAGSGKRGYADGPGWQAQFSYPGAVALDAAGNLYVADLSNLRIRKISIP